MKIPGKVETLPRPLQEEKGTVKVKFGEEDRPGARGTEIENHERHNLGA